MEDLKARNSPDLYKEIRENLSQAMTCWVSADEKGLVEAMDAYFKSCAKLGFITINSRN